jgi:hypothetical protein
MAIKVRGKTDPVLNLFLAALKKYQADHPKAKIDIYRQWEFSVRMRIIDPDLKGLDLIERDNLAWKYFEKIPEEPLSQMGMFVLLTPQEKAMSMANLEFDDPVPVVGSS